MVRIPNLTAVLKVSSALLRHRKAASDVAMALARGRIGEAAHRARTATRRPDVLAEKVVSHKYKYLWLCNPKVASRSIISALCSADASAEIIRNASVSRVYEMYPEAAGYFSFAFVRHPMTRAYSLYRELLWGDVVNAGKRRLLKRGRRERLLHEYYGLDAVGTFEEFCEWLSTPYGSDAFADRHFLSQSMQLRLPDGCLPDFIGRFESLDEDLNLVAERLGLPGLSLPLLNSMAGWKAERGEVESARSKLDDCRTPRIEELVRTRYADDFRIGGYAPDVANAVEVWESNGEWRKAGKISTPKPRPIISVVVEMSRQAVTGRIPIGKSIQDQLERQEQFDKNSIEFIFVGNSVFNPTPFGENVISAKAPKGGHFEYLNAGASIARGEYVTFWAGDCKASSGYLPRAVDLLNNSPELSGVASMTRYNGRNWLTELNTIVSFGYLYSVGQEELNSFYPALSHGVVIRKSAFPDRPFGDYSAMYGGDMRLTEHARRSGAPLRLDPNMTVLHEDISFSPKALLERHLREIFSMDESLHSDRRLLSAFLIALKSPYWRYARVKSYAPFFGWKRLRIASSLPVLALYGLIDVCAMLVLAISPRLQKKWFKYQFGE